MPNQTYLIDLSCSAEFALVPNLQIGYLEGEAPAFRDRKLELPGQRFQAGAWERVKMHDARLDPFFRDPFFRCRSRTVNEAPKLG